jgi:hypothetical protein
MVPVELDGLLVPVAVSATHVGYSAIRMEPAWTALGQAAGLAAAMAAKEGVEARRVAVPRLQARLHEAGAFTVYITDLFPERNVPRPAWDPPGHFTAHVTEWPSVTKYSRAAQYFGTRGFFHPLSPEFRGGAVGRSTGQWSIGYPEHAVGFEQPIDAALAARWLDLARVKPGPGLAADGQVTRGEFLNRLFTHINSR